MITIKFSSSFVCRKKIVSVIFFSHYFKFFWKLPISIVFFICSHLNPYYFLNKYDAALFAQYDAKRLCKYEPSMSVKKLK